MRRPLGDAIYVEAVVHDADDRFSADDFVQPDPALPEGQWQVAWMPTYLSPDGETVLSGYPDSVAPTEARSHRVRDACLEREPSAHVELWRACVPSLAAHAGQAVAPGALRDGRLTNAMTASPNRSRWLWLPIAFAAVSFALAAVDMTAALIAITRTEHPTLALTVPVLILVLSAFTLRLAIPALRPPETRRAPPRWLCWIALLCGAAVALLSGFEIAYGLVQEGIAVLLDFPAVMVFVLSVSCAAVALAAVRRRA